MINSRFNGEHTSVNTRGLTERRQVLILSPYVQTSESSIDFDRCLVVDMQSLEHDYKVQLEDMMQNHESNAYKTFMDYGKSASFRNGDNVLTWLHSAKAISSVNVDDVAITIYDGGNHKINRIPLREINNHIKTEMEANQAHSGQEFSDPSFKEGNYTPALVEGGQRKENQVVQESVESEVSEEVTATPDTGTMTPEERLALSMTTAPELLGNMENEQDASNNVSVPNTTDNTESNTVSYDEIAKRLDKLDKKITKSKDTVVNRLIEKYDLTEAEAVKAIESAGERKRKRLEKQKDKQKQK